MVNRSLSIRDVPRAMELQEKYGKETESRVFGCATVKREYKASR